MYFPSCFSLSTFVTSCSSGYMYSGVTTALYGFILLIILFTRCFPLAIVVLRCPCHLLNTVTIVSPMYSWCVFGIVIT